MNAWQLACVVAEFHDPMITMSSNNIQCHLKRPYVRNLTYNLLAFFFISSKTKTKQKPKQTMGKSDLLKNCMIHLTATICLTTTMKIVVTLGPTWLTTTRTYNGNFSSNCGCMPRTPVEIFLSYICEIPGYMFTVFSPPVFPHGNSNRMLCPQTFLPVSRLAF